MLQNGLHWFPGRQMRTSEAQRGSPAPSHTAGERYLRASECGPAQGLDTVHLKCPCSAVCDPVDCSPPGPCVHGILQARILEWVAVPSPGCLPDSGIEPLSLMSPEWAGRFFTSSTTWEPLYACNFPLWHFSQLDM